MSSVIVVGAGSAGCVVAARLAEDPTIEVLLVEAGADRDTESRTALAERNWIGTLARRDAFYSALSSERVDGGGQRPYMRGRGVGGSAAVNAMLALPGLPSDYDTWAGTFWCDDWAWERVEPWFAKLKNDLTLPDAESYTVVDRALIAAAKDCGWRTDVDSYEPSDGAGPIWQNSNENGRYSAVEVYLDPIRSQPNLTIKSDSQVDHLMMSADKAVGVRLSSGEEHLADHVVLSAGVFESPAILLRSKLSHAGIGKNLQDHPAVTAYLNLRPDRRTDHNSGRSIGVLLRQSSSVGNGDIHFLPQLGSFPGSKVPHDATLTMALMKVSSVGELSLDRSDPLAPPQISQHMLSTPADQRAFADGIRLLEQLLESRAFQAITDGRPMDASGAPFSRSQDNGGVLDDGWLTAHVGDYFHACGTARMGDYGAADSVVDQQGRVHGVHGLSVIDASVMPTVPAANTHLPTTMIAERLSAALREQLGETSR